MAYFWVLGYQVSVMDNSVLRVLASVSPGIIKITELIAGFYYAFLGFLYARGGSMGIIINI